MATVRVISHVMFDDMCNNNKWDDANIENETNKAFISIVGCKECLDLFEIEQREHWFKENHSNVLNLNFDDTSKTIFYKGAWILSMSEEQAKQVVEFIEKNVGKDFYVHCLAGISRSGAIGRFIMDNYEEYKNSEQYNTHIRPNQGCLTLMNGIMWNKKFGNKIE